MQNDKLDVAEYLLPYQRPKVNVAIQKPRVRHHIETLCDQINSKNPVAETNVASKPGIWVTSGAFGLPETVPKSCR